MFKQNRWILTNRYRVLSSALCLFVFCLYAQNTQPQTTTPENGKVQKVILEHANKLSFDKLVTGDAQVLRGDVRFRQEGMYMFCDSAYFYEANNSLDAFGNVRMEQGDTLFVFSDFLRYNGTSRLAELRYNVKMENRDVTLLTDSLNYDRMVNVGYYFEGGVLTDPENELISYYGQYSPDTKMARFNDNVKLINEKYTLYSDTLDYDTNTRIADIIGPSTIISDSNTIYSSRGWYNTLADVATLYDRSSVVSGERVLTADTLFYNRNTGFGEGFTNVEVTDTVKKMTLYGQYGYYNEISEHAFVTDSSWLMDYSRPDTLYLAADTLMTYPDSTFRIMEAIKRVRMFSEQSQAVAGKAIFTSRDTLMKMMDDPILWNENYQVFGDSILTYMNDSTIDWAHIKNFGFIAEHIDSSYFNQISGKDIKGYFKEGDLKTVLVSGNVLLKFYPLESDGVITGQYSGEASYLKANLKQKELEKVVLWPSPKGQLVPLHMLKKNQYFLNDFRWYDYLRPVDRYDIFREVTRKQEDAPVKHIRRSQKK